MTRRTPSLEPVRDVEVGRRERARLDVALRAAAVDADSLDATRTVLLARLFRRPDDFAATSALQALNAFTAGQRADARSDAPAQLRAAGLSSLERLRRRRTVRAT
jgi:hypothetical protein